ncbi:hypothetical protein [Rahnella perminowiae]|uniref:DinB/UmuC family translesion DNA polymerase n=1 Tax=Rahnella perminowiae TaxID=2816244 RepID=UPI003B8A5FFC
MRRCVRPSASMPNGQREKLRGEHQYCRHISVFVKTSPFAFNEIYYSNVATEKLTTPTRDTRDIIAAAMKALDRIWDDGRRYAKAGIMLNDFTPNGVSQLICSMKFSPALPVTR